jgi:transcriptional regulator with XRE-family HTH domain
VIFTFMLRQMDKQAALEALHQRAFSARVPMYKVCDRAGVARSTLSRWKANPNIMSPTTLGKLEDALSLIEADRVAAS